MGERTAVVLVGIVAAVFAAGVATVTRVESDGPRPAAAAAVEPLRATGGSEDAVQPGGSVTGVLRITNRASSPRSVSEVVFGPVTSAQCDTTGLVLSPTFPPTPESPLEVPARGEATLELTGYMDGNGDHACQGADLTSEVSLDGEAAGEVSVTAGTLERPPAPTGGLTTGTRAAVRWSASSAAAPGWVLERAVAGTGAWQPACGSSTAAPLRTLACTDTGLTKSTSYVYRLTLRTGHWHATSLPSAPVRTQARPSA